MAWKPDYLTLAAAKAFLRINDTDDDTEIAVWITAASRAIDRHTNRQFGKVDAAEQRFYTAHWDRRRARWVIAVDDLMSTAGLVVVVQSEEGTTLGTIDQFDLEPRNAAQEGRPWEQLVVKTTSAQRPTGRENEVAITGPWGWTAIPVPVTSAARLQVSRFHSRRDSPFGIAGSPDVGSELRLLARLDPDVAVSLGAYIRWWAGA